MTSNIKFVLWLIFGYYVYATSSSNVDDTDGDLDQQSQGFHVNGNDILHAIRQLRQQMFDIREEIIGRIDTIEAKMGNANVKMDSLDSKVVEIDIKMSSTKETFGKIEPLLLSWEENLGKHIETLKTDISNIVNDKLGRLESEVGNIKTKEDNIEMNVGNITAVIGALEANFLNLEPKITAITQETEGIETTLKELASLPMTIEKKLQNYQPPEKQLNSSNPYPLLLKVIWKKILFTALTSINDRSSCYEISRVTDKPQNGVYELYPLYDKKTNSIKSILAYCDMETNGGGWTVFQRRGIPGNLTETERSDLFNKTWNGYKNGFGDPNYDYWLGLDSVHQLTKECNHELLVKLTHINGTLYQVYYSNFKVSSEKDKYKLIVSGYVNDNSTLDDGLKRHSGFSFSTIDRDNDEWGESCSVERKANGFWFVNCFDVSLNGLYPSSRQPLTMSSNYAEGIIWHSNDWQKFRRTEMKIRSTC